VEKGYVERQPDADDRRRIYLRLTEKGAEISEYAHTKFRSSVSSFLSPLGDDQLRDITLACTHIATLLPESMYEYEGVCPVRPVAFPASEEVTN